MSYGTSDEADVPKVKDLKKTNLLHLFMQTLWLNMAMVKFNKRFCVASPLFYPSSLFTVNSFGVFVPWIVAW